MKRRRYHLPPPKNATYRSGVVVELSAADDRINAGKPLPPDVELMPVGPPLLVIDVLPEDATTEQNGKTAANRPAASEGDYSRRAAEHPADAVGASKAAVVAAVVRMVELLKPEASNQQAIEAIARDFVERLARLVADPAPEPLQK